VRPLPASCGFRQRRHHRRNQDAPPPRLRRRRPRLPRAVLWDALVPAAYAWGDAGGARGGLSGVLCREGGGAGVVVLLVVWVGDGVCRAIVG
jgi:hypothetical protein